MRFGLGHLRLAPTAFWRLSMIEYDAAFVGYLEAKGAKPAGSDMTRARLDELKSLYPDT
jgi:uncharacterized phage protein (TIGR02216 family)